MGDQKCSLVSAYRVLSSALVSCQNARRQSRKTCDVWILLCPCGINNNNNNNNNNHCGAFVYHLLPRKSSKFYIFRVCVCTLSYPVCKAHAPSYHLWPVRLYHTFQHYLINGKICGKNCRCKWNRVLIFFTSAVCNISHSKKSSAK